jgi:septal ring factor EnvC (AmiA/AmiB activator)
MADDAQKQILETLQRLDARTASLETTLNEVSVAVAALTVGQRESRDTLHVIEKKLEYMDARLDRIERHTGLVKA